jgi:nicotinate-nucleotide pyrophosphorylase (carboxylating)
MHSERFSTRRMVRHALEEDLGPGDATTMATVAPNDSGEAILIAREELLLAGMSVFKQTFFEVDSSLAFAERYKDGDVVPEGSTVCRIRGRLAAILSGERTALNFLQRMSGIATLTRRYVDAVEGSRAKILDTRKTAPGSGGAINMPSEPAADKITGSVCLTAS